MRLGVRDSGDLERDRDHGEGEDTIYVQVSTTYKSFPRRGTLLLTHASNDLSLHTILVLETIGKVADASLSITSHIRNLADVVEHVSAGEEQDGDEGNGGPDVAALDDGEYVGPGDVGKGEAAGCDDKGRDPLDPVDRPLDGRVRAAGHVAG